MRLNFNLLDKKCKQFFIVGWGIFYMHCPKAFLLRVQAVARGINCLNICNTI